MATIGEILVSLRADLAQFQSGMTDAVRRIGEVADSANASRSKIESFGAQLNKLADAAGVFAAAEVGRKIFEVAEGAAAAGAEIAHVAERVGLSASAYQEFGFAARQAGVEQEKFAASVGIFARNIGQVAENGGEKAAKVLSRLKISITDANTGALLPMQQVLTTFLGKLAAVKEPAIAAYDAFALFGRQGLAMVNVAKEVAEQGFDKIAKQARAAGLVLSDDVVAGAKQAHDEFEVLSQVVQNQMITALTNLGPVITTTTSGLGFLAKAMGQVFGNNPYIASFSAQTKTELEAGRRLFQQQLTEYQNALDNFDGQSWYRRILAPGDRDAILHNIDDLRNKITATSAAIKIVSDDAAGSAGKPGKAVIDPQATAAAAAYGREIAKLTASLGIAKEKNDALADSYNRGRTAVLAATAQIAVAGGAQKILDAELANAQIKYAGVEAAQKLWNAAAERHVKVTQRQIEGIRQVAENAERARIEAEAAKRAANEQVQATNALITGLARHKEAIDKTKMATDALTGEQKALADEEGRVLQAFQQGTISLQQFEERRRELQSQVDGTTASMKKFGDQVGSSLSSSADNFISVALTAGQAKDAFAAFGQAALSLANDIAKLIIQLLIVEPLIKALKTWLGFDTGISGGAASSSAASTASSTGSAASRATITLPQSSFRPADGQLVSFRPNGVTGEIPSRAGGGNLSVSIINAPPGYAAKSATSQDSPGGRDIVIELEERLAGRMRRGSALGREVQNSYGGQLQMTPR